MERISFKEITALGNLGYRAIKSFSRLNSKIYQPEYVMKAEKDTSWPGDWLGRTLFGVVMLSKSTGAQGAYLDELLTQVDILKNERGYLGEILSDGIFDEQQFSAHNWLLRALLEYYQWKKDKRVLKQIWDIVENLFLPATGYYENYPTKKEDRVFAGEKSGSLTGAVINHWKTSSDTGCAFMCLDGLAQLYSIFPDERIKTLLEEMICAFSKIDFININMQTHATLSASRGIIKFYSITKKQEYLNFVKNIFQLYLDYGATANYANFNWFCRAEWTEPCGIIDSYILSFELFVMTGEISYLKIANRIYYNALCFAQRLNGGFGCDICVGPEEKLLRADIDSNIICEAYWCCTMRGGDGIARYIENSFLKEEKTLYLTHYIDCKLTMMGFSLSEKSKFPRSGHVVIEANRETGSEIETIALYIPDYAENCTVSVNGKNHLITKTANFEKIAIEIGKSTIELCFDISLQREDCLGKDTEQGRYCFWHGDMMIGTETEKCIENVIFDLEYLGDGIYKDKNSNTLFSGLMDNIDIELDNKNLVKSVQIIFG